MKNLKIGLVFALIALVGCSTVSGQKFPVSSARTPASATVYDCSASVVALDSPNLVPIYISYSKNLTGKITDLRFGREKADSAMTETNCTQGDTQTARVCKPVKADELVEYFILNSEEHFPMILSKGMDPLDIVDCSPRK